MTDFQYFLEKLKENKNLNQQESYQAFGLIADNKAQKEDVKEFLLLINKFGISEELLFGAAKSLDERSIKLKAPKNAIDVCGTGGDKSNSLNISTTVAIILASMKIAVAKHGNKAVSSNSGSADIFKEIGINLDKSKKEVEESLEKNNLAFIFAPLYHPALKNVAPIRQELGVRTIFNFLGPLISPARPKYQLIGCSSKEVAKIMINVCKLLGKESCMVVSGFDGMDEISISDNTLIYSFDKKTNEIREEIFNPENYEIKKRSSDLIKGKDPKYNAQKLIELLKGNINDEKSKSYLDIVSLNTAASLIIAKKFDNFKESIEFTKSHIKSGKAYEFLTFLNKS